MQDVLLIREKRTDQLPAVRSGGTVVFATVLEVLREKHLSFDLHYFLSKRVFVVAVVDFAMVLNVNFQDVLH